MLVDSHCHLDLLDLPTKNDLAAVVADAAAQDVQHLLSVSVELTRLDALLAQAAPFAQISVSCGLHPNEAPGEIPSVAELIQLAQHAKIVAIGETGLDYYRSDGDLQWQETRFRHHIQAAKQLALPLIVHTRQARDDTLRILREEEAAAVGGVLHCFTEDWEMASEAMDMGFYISFSGIVTFKNAQKLQSVAKQVPLERLLVETDSPFLAPVPYRGKPNFPAYVRHVAEFVATLRATSFAEIATASTANFFRLFPKALPA